MPPRARGSRGRRCREGFAGAKGSTLWWRGARYLPTGSAHAHVTKGFGAAGYGQTAAVVEPANGDAPNVPSDNTTLLAVLNAFAEEGWTENMSATDEGEIRCPACSTVSPAGDVSPDELRRLEGASDPDDMMAVLAITCPNCAAKGVIVANFGPNASEADALLMQALDDHQPGD